MSKKIKEIEIEAFRAYKDLQKFELIHKESGEIANLVAIYAPNGYGKTSFFDAIEWAITNKIGRFEGKTPTSEEVKEEVSFILKNKDSEKKQGRVKIVDEQDNFIEVKTKEIIRNMKGDYRERGELLISPSLQTILEEKDTFCVTNLLAHDKITGFLQNYTGEEKTAALRIMWDKNKFSDIADKLDMMCRELDKRLIALQKNIKDKEKELKQFKFENNHSDKLKEIMTEYINKHNVLLNITDLEYSNIDSILEVIQQYSNSSNSEEESLIKSIDTYQRLISENPLYLKDLLEIETLKENKISCEKEIFLINEINTRKNKLELLKLQNLNLETLIRNLPRYYEIIETITKLNNEIGFATKNKNILKEELINLDKKTIELKKKINDIKEVKEQISIEKEQIIGDYNIYQHSLNAKLRYSRLIEKGNYIIEQRKKCKNKILHEMNALMDFQKDKKKIELVEKLLSHSVLQNTQGLLDLQNELHLLVENNSTLASNKRKLIELLSQMEQIQEYGKTVIIESQTDKCPLCHMKYDNNEKLLERINTGLENDIQISSINTQIEKNNNRMKELEETIQELTVKIDDEIQVVFNSYQNQYAFADHKETRILGKRNIWMNLLEQQSNTCQNILNRNNGLYIFEGDHINETLEQFTYKSDLLIQECNNLEKELAARISEMEVCQSNLHNIELNIVQNQSILDENLISKEYIEMKELLINNKLYKSEYSNQEMLLVLEEEYKTVNELVDSLSISIESDSKRIKKTKEESEKNLQAIHMRLTELEVRSNSYLSRCKELGINEDIDNIDRSLQNGKQQLEDKKENLNQKMILEKQLLLYLNDLKEQKLWLNKKTEIEYMNLEYLKLEKHLLRLNEGKDIVENFIVEQTNMYFNSELINQIYSKIDPHPTMKHIKFKVDRTKKGIKTHIYAYDVDEHNSMSPVVYLSSAQVNILSLCIFLSKVLSEKNITFNTIFMDDPIQHLDGINLLAFIDLLRTLTTEMGRQVVISTYNEQFFNLLQTKMSDEYYPTRFIRLDSTGVICEGKN